MRQYSAHLTIQVIEVGEINASHCDISTPNANLQKW
jgi:hypothetical protein